MHTFHSTAPDLLQDLRRLFSRGMIATFLVGNMLALLAILPAAFFILLYHVALPSRSFAGTLYLALAALIAIAGIGVLDMLMTRICRTVGNAILDRLQGTMFHACIRATVDGRSAEAAQGLRDFETLSGFPSSGAVLLPAELMMTPLYLLVLFAFGWPYGLMGLTFVAVLAVLNVWTATAATPRIVAANVSLGLALGSMPMIARASDALRAMGMLPAISGRLHRRLQNALNLSNSANQRAKAFTAAARSLRYSFTAVLVGVSVLLILDGTKLGAGFLGVTLLVSRLLAPYEQLHEGWHKWMEVLGAYRRIARLLSLHSGLRQDIDLPRPEGGLVVERLVYVPPGTGRPILKGGSFSVARGSAVGIVGPSGAGKSTLARLLVGLWSPTGGGVYLGGTSTFLWSRASFGRAVGYLPQRPQLLPGTVAENIARMAPDHRASDIAAAARAAGIHSLVAGLPNGYDTWIDDATPLLSGGQKQRLALARALYGNPDLLVFDEPNSNLDAVGEAALLKAISDAKHRGACIIVIAHRVSILETMDRVLVLRDGLFEVSPVAGAAPTNTETGNRKVSLPAIIRGRVAGRATPPMTQTRGAAHP